MVADKVCNAWVHDNKVSNIQADTDGFDYTEFNLVINCSVEHMNSGWFDTIPDRTLVCVQSSNVTDHSFPWLVTNPNTSMESLAKKYPLGQTLFSGEKEFNYGTWGYKRFMLIGIK
jgi:hypothetical protein